MIEFKPKEEDLILDKRPRIVHLHDALQEVQSIVFKDEGDRIHDFLEFDTVYHLIDTIEDHYKNYDLRSEILRERGGSDDFNYSGNYKWTYGTTFKNRIATKDALLNSEVPDLMWKVIDKLRDSLLACLLYTSPSPRD